MRRSYDADPEASPEECHIGDNDYWLRGMFVSLRVQSGYMGNILFQVHRLHFSPSTWITTFDDSLS